MKAVNDGLVAKVETSNTFNTAIGGRFYFDEAPQKATFPFAVYYDISGDFDWTFSTNITTVIIQIRLLSKTSGAAEIEDLRTKLLALLEYKSCTLTVSGFSFIYIKQINEDSPTRIDDVWNYNVQFEIEVEVAE